MSDNTKRYAVTVDGREFEVQLNGSPACCQINVGATEPMQCNLAVSANSRQYSLLLDNHSYEGLVESTEDGIRVWVEGEPFDLQVIDARLKGLGGVREAGGGEKKAAMTTPMPGMIVAVLCAVGDEVTKGQPLVTLESMKMRNDLKSPRDGVVKEVKTAAGQTVAKGDVVVVFEG